MTQETEQSASPPDRAEFAILLDAPAAQPQLGYDGIAQALADIVTHSTPHFAIGIFGKWGAGKTTLMEAVERKLDHKTAVSVRFVAWRYEREEHLIVPLLDTIRDALVEWSDSDDAATPEAKQASRTTARRIGRVMRAIVAGTSVKIGVPGAIDVSFDANKALAATKATDDEDAVARTPRSFYHASYAALRDAFKEFAGPSNERRIVVFIDDLDRCLPESALQVLESMKLFFDIPGFVFVVGLDRDIVQRVVTSKFQLYDGNGDGTRDSQLGDDYVKKIFQVPYDLDPVAVNLLPSFLSSAYEEADLPDAQRDEFREIVERHLTYLLRDGSVNPREVKRYLNAFTITMKIQPWLDRDAVLAVLMIEFRPDWAECGSALLAYGDLFVDALTRLHDGQVDAFDDIGLDFTPPDPFVSYTREGEPGNALLTVPGIDRYILNVGTGESTRDADIRGLLPDIGGMRRILAALKDNPAGATAAYGSARAALSKVRSTIGRFTPPPLLARDVLDEVDQLEGLLPGMQKRAELPDLDLAEWNQSVDAMVRTANALTKRVQTLYLAPPGPPPPPMPPRAKRDVAESAAVA